MPAYLQRVLPGLFLSAVTLLPSACITLPEMKNRWSFVCPDGYVFFATYSRNKQSVRLSADNLAEKLRLRDANEIAAEARYASSDVEFLTRGVMANLRIGSDSKTGDSSGSGTAAAHLQCQGSAY